MPLFSTLTDDFSGTLAKWPASSTSTTIVNGRARLVCDTGYQSLQSSATFSLQSSAVFAQMFPGVGGGAATDADLSINVTSTTAGTLLAIVINSVSGMLSFQSQVGYYDSSAISIAYDPVAHLWLRIREAASITYWETSPEGQNWVVRRTIVTPGWVVGATTLQLQFVAHRDAGTTDYAQISKVNLAPPSTPGSGVTAPVVFAVSGAGLALMNAIVPFGSISDDFSTTLAKWPLSSGSTGIVNSRARVVCDTGYQALQTDAKYSLASSFVSAQVFPPAAGGAASDADVSMMVATTTAGTGLFARVNVFTGLLTFSAQTGYNDLNASNIAYDAVAHSWLRIREASGTVFWETAPDGINWVTRRTVTTPAYIAGATTLQLAFVTHRDAGTVDYTEIRAFNLTPSLRGGSGATGAVAFALSGSGAPVANAVVPIGTINDQFSGDLSRWPGSSTSTTIVNGRVRLVCDTGYQSLNSAAVYSLTNSAIYAQVAAPVAGGAATDADVSMNVNTTTAGTGLSTQINRFTGLLTFAAQTGYWDPAAVKIAYNFVTHRWLRIREASGTVYWETSPNGVSWTVQRQAPTPSYIVGATTLQVSFFTHRDAGTVDYAEIDGINGSISAANAGTYQLYQRVTFGAFYSDTVAPGGFGDCLYSPADGSAQYRWQQYYNFNIPRVVYFAGWAADIPSGAMFYSGKGYRLVRAWDVEYFPGPTYARALVPFADILAGLRDADLNKVFTQHAAFVGGVDFRMWWEMNLPGTQSSPIWNGALPASCTSAAQWVQTWCYVVNYARKNFPTADFRFCWVPNGQDVGITMESMYPGDAYVDVVGADIYNETTYSTWQTFPQKVQPVYDRLAKITTNSNIPMILGETGSTTGAAAGQSVADYLRSMFTTTAMPRLKQVDFFNVNKEKDWRITTTAESTAAAQQYLAPIIQAIGRIMSCRSQSVAVPRIGRLVQVRSQSVRVATSGRVVNVRSQSLSGGSGGVRSGRIVQVRSQSQLTPIINIAAEPHVYVDLGVGAHRQTAGPTVTFVGSVFLTPALPAGAVLRFSDGYVVTVYPHTRYRARGGMWSPEFDGDMRAVPVGP